MTNKIFTLGLLFSLSFLKAVSGSELGFSEPHATIEDIDFKLSEITQIHRQRLAKKKAYGFGWVNEFFEEEVRLLANYSTGIADFRSLGRTGCEFSLIASEIIVTSGHCLNSVVKNGRGSVLLYLGASSSTGSPVFKEQYVHTEYAKVPLFIEETPQFVRVKDVDLALIKIPAFKKGKPVKPIPNDLFEGFESIAYIAKSGISLSRDIKTGVPGVLVCSMESNFDEWEIDLSPSKGSFYVKCTSDEFFQTFGNSGSGFFVKSVDGDIYYRGSLATDSSFANGLAVLSDEFGIEGGDLSVKLKEIFLSLIEP